ncbi:diaminopimelate decarboxylase [Nocardia sp. NPDC050710]|uniref:diaminopimelate decarboxylase family protein n=1 Tax=Nocardia sp. NPDC050710 TaxID=3157220 RepID=UPI0033C017A1
MTLLDFFSSPRPGSTTRLDAAIWPRSARYAADGRLTVGGVALTEIADRFGTASCVLDEREVRDRCRAYRRVFPEAEIVFAGSALPVRAVAGWVAEEGLSIAVRSAGELAVALAAGVAPNRIIMHGSGEDLDALETAVACHVGRVAVSSGAEIDLLGGVATRPQRVLLRVDPAVRTGGEGPHGIPIDEVAAAIERIAQSPMLELIGLQCHLGSQLYNPDYYGEAIRRMVAEMAQIRRDTGRVLTALDLGGGHAVAYRSGDAEMNLTELADIIDDALDAACARNRFPRPNIALTPGRGIVARAGITLYRVRSVKRNDGGQTSIVIDSGRPDPLVTAAIGTAPAIADRLVTGALCSVTIAGMAGDHILASDIRLPADLRAGELLAVPCTGAYQSGRGNTRLPIIAVRGGRSEELVRREPNLLDRDAG